MTNPPSEQKLMHYAPTQKRLRQLDPMCGYLPPDDDISLDPRRCTCVECLGWITPSQESK